MIALLATLLLAQESTWYHTPGYSPPWQLPSRPWQGIAVDSAGQVYVVHGQAKGPGNKSISGTQIRIFSPQGEEVAEWSTPHGFISGGIAVDEKQRRIYVASDFHHVRVFDWRDGRITPLPDRVATKDGGRCAGVSLGRDGTMFTADLGENRVYRFYPAGGHSSFGSGPGEGEQGFNHVRRVFESPVDGSLYVLDFDGIRQFTPTGQFLKRIAGKILAMAPDGKPLATLPGDILDAAVGKDGRVYVIPRGEEFCCAAYDAGGKLLWRRGADYDRLTVTVEAGKPRAEFSNALKAGLLTAAEKKVAERRPQNPPIHVFLKGVKLEKGFVLPKGTHTLRVAIDGPGPAVDVAVTVP